MPADAEVIWTTPSGEVIPLDGEVINALACVADNFLGAEVAWWRQNDRQDWKAP